MKKLWTCKYEKCNETWTENPSGKLYCSTKCKQDQKNLTRSRNNYHIEAYQKRKKKLKEQRDAIKAVKLANPDIKKCPTCTKNFPNNSIRPMTYCSEFCRRNSNYEKKKLKRHQELMQDKVCACRDCDKKFTTIYKTKKYCSDKCMKLESKYRTGWMPKPVADKVKDPKKRKKVKKKYKPISKPDPKKNKVVMALSKDVINCLEPEKKKGDDLIQRDYTDKEAAMIEAFMSKNETN
jgi:hypothetical protein